MRRLLCPALAAALLAGCSVKVDTADAKDADNSAGGDVNKKDKDGQFALSVPGFSAKLAIPGLHFSPRDMDIDGLKLFPDARTTAMNVNAHDEGDKHDDGIVRIDFASAAPPSAVIDYYRGEAPRAGYTIDPSPAAGSAFSASKPTRDGTTRLAIALHPVAAGSTGTVTITGG